MTHSLQDKATARRCCPAPVSRLRVWRLLTGLLLALGLLPGTSFGQASWMAQNSGIAVGSLVITQVSVVSPTVAWATSGGVGNPTPPGQIFTHTTNGVNWTSGTLPGAASLAYSDISAVSASTAWVTLYDATSGLGGYIYRTTDGGANWVRQNSTAFVPAQGGFADVIHMYDANTGWCLGDPTGGYFEMYLTSNGGTTWTRVPSSNIPAPLNGEGGFNTVKAVSGNNIWFGTNLGRVYHSTDQGANWTVSSTGTTNEVRRVAFSDALNGLVYLFSASANATYLYRTSDGGQTWAPVQPTGTANTPYLVGVPGVPQLFVSAGPSGSSYSSDGGTSWNIIDTQAHGNLAFLNGQVGWSGGYTGVSSPSMYRWQGVSVNGYCTPVHPACNSSGGPAITAVAIPNSTLSRNSACEDLSGPGYSVIPPTPASNTATLQPGGAYSLAVTTSASAIVSMWIDYNHNLMFDATEWQQVSTATVAGQPSSVAFVVPAAAVLGATAVRIRSRTTGNLNGSGDACTAFGSGETEDYTVTIATCNVPVPMPSISGSTCQGSTVTLSAPAVANATSYSWAGPNGYSATTLSITLANLTAANSGTYTLTATGAQCSSQASINLTVTSPPNATISASGPTTFCQGSSVTLSVPAGNRYLWSTGATTASITVTTAGSYSVTVTNPTGCSATSAATQVTVNPVPSAAFSYPAANFCQSGTNPTPTVTGTAGGTFAAGTGLVLDSATGTITLASSTPGTYTVVYTVPGTCPGSASATVTITRPSSAAFSYSSPSGYCAGAGTATISLASGSSAGTFTSTAGLVLSTGTGAINLTSSTPGTYTVTNTVGTIGACAAVSATTTVTINAAAVAIAGPNRVFCSGQSAALGSAPVAGTTYAWTPTTGLSSATVANPTVTLSNMGSAPLVVNYTLTATTAAGCSASSTVAVTVNFMPVATISPSGPTTFCQGGLVLLNASGGSSYQWSNGATTASISVSTSGTYTVTAISAAGCTAASTPVTVTVNPMPATPTITRAGNTLSSSAAAGNQWYLNGTAIAGATNATYLAAVSGSYTVVVTGPGSCTSNPSAALAVTVTATKSAVPGTSLEVAPNPVGDGPLLVTLSGYSQPVSLVLIDGLGRTVRQVAVVPALAGTTQVHLDLSALPPGIYVLQSRTATGLDARRIVRQ